MQIEDLKFLYEEQAENENYLKADSFNVGIGTEAKERYMKIYHEHVNSAYNMDWNCSSCVMAEMRRLYSVAELHKHKLTEVAEEITPTEEAKADVAEDIVAETAGPENEVVSEEVANEPAQEQEATQIEPAKMKSARK